MIPKFRAWDKRTKLMNDVTTIDLEKEIVFYHHWRYGHSKAIPFSDVELMQSTGLKDKNGIEIFEGDVVKVQAEEPEPKIRADRHATGVIIYDYGSFEIETKPNTVSGLISESHLSDIKLTYEVIGNKYEHPHLLEE